VLRDCLNLAGIKNEAAENKYFELANMSVEIAQVLLDIINLEYDDIQLNRLLDSQLKLATKIGMRGELVDIAKAL
jgi:hypothetical protein